MDYLSEDFLELGNTKPIKKCFKYAMESCSHERFGFFAYINYFSDYDFFTLDNLDLNNPDHFIVDGKEFYTKYFKDEIISLFHTHVIDDPTPSEMDIALSDALNIPTYILSCSSKKSYLRYPSKFEYPAKVDKRIFIPYFQDCITFIKDFYLSKLKIDLSENIKNWSRDLLNPNQKLINILKNHFSEVSKDNLKFGDLVLMPQTTTNLLHLGVLDSNLKINHHPMGMYPKKEIFTSVSSKEVYTFYRYKVL